MATSTKRFSNVNGKATKLKKPFTEGSLGYIVENAGKMKATSLANVLHRPVAQVRYAAKKLGVSL